MYGAVKVGTERSEVRCCERYFGVREGFNSGMEKNA
jgi:hypothetical protein